MTGKYRTIVADPPWHMEFGARTHSDKGWQSHDGVASVLPYETMSVDEIAALPVRHLADKTAHLYLWTINAYLEDTWEIARLWGFRPAALLTWCKAPMGLGLGGTFVQTTEHVLFARRGILPAAQRIDSTWFQWPRSGEHSRKPEAFNVHHRTYERLGKERLGDLTVLCRKCHGLFHGKAA